MFIGGTVTKIKIRIRTLKKLNFLLLNNYNIRINKIKEKLLVYKISYCFIAIII
jgi:hypothetical protein